MKVLIVTGGIGSGKSVVCRYMHARYGWPVYEADIRVKQLYLTHPTLLSDIEDLLGVTLRDQSGRFVPQSLAEVIFSDDKALARVEELVFPVLTEDFEQWKLDHSESGVVVLESATILEKPQLKGIGDITLLIDAPVSLREERAAARSAVSREGVRSRMATQRYMNDISNGIVESPADYMIVNDGTLTELEEKIQKIVEILL